MPAQVMPNGRFVIVRTPRHRHFHTAEHRIQLREVRATLLALVQVLRNRRAVFSAFSVIVQSELFVCEVLHFADLTNGPSAVRIFCTARKMQFFVAPSAIPNVLPISSIELPSKCRITNAVRSDG